MRRLVALLIVLAAVAAAPSAGVVIPFKATLKTPATQPQIDVKWYYSVKATDLQNRPIRARLTGVVIDPIGGVHKIERGPSTKTVTNWPFRGTFRDYLIFPLQARGFVLTLRWTVKATIGGKTYKRVLTRKVTPE